MPFLNRTQRPQRARVAVTTSLLESMMGDPGLRLAETTGRRTYSGGALAPQKFVRPPAPAGPNDAALDTAPIAVNARRSLNRTRGAM